VLISLDRLSFFAALLLAIAAITPAPLPRPKIGEPAPAFTLRDQNRKPVSLANAAGTKVVLIFYRGYW
jgi:cytochrome oxidase Cu insertion factor (SCO1/SenC/PrrC family)